MPSVINGQGPTSNGGPSVASRNGSSSFINGKGNASAFGNNIAQTNGNAELATEGNLSSKDGNRVPGNTKLRRAEELEEVSLIFTWEQLCRIYAHAESTESFLMLSRSSLFPSLKGLMRLRARSTQVRRIVRLQARPAMYL